MGCYYVSVQIVVRPLTTYDASGLVSASPGRQSAPTAEFFSAFFAMLRTARWPDIGTKIRKNRL